MEKKTSFWIMVSSGFGTGYLPKAPGTWSALVAIPLWWSLSNLSWPLYALIVLGFSSLSVLVANRAEGIYGEHDRGEIVIDEIVGLMIASIAVPFTMAGVVLVFIYFRVFDIAKPGPIGWIDQNVKGGLGVILDDALAGVFALIAVHVTLYLGV